MTFADDAAYLAFWRDDPAFGADGARDERVEQYVTSDLGGKPPELRSRGSKEAARADYVDLVTGATAADYRQIGGPHATDAGAPRPARPAGAVASDRTVAEHLPEIPGARHELVAGTNHYTIVMGRGAPVVADRIRAAVAAGRDVLASGG